MDLPGTPLFLAMPRVTRFVRKSGIFVLCITLWYFLSRQANMAFFENTLGFQALIEDVHLKITHF